MKKVLSILSILLVMVTLSAATISSPAATVNLTKNKVITMDQLNKEVELYTKNGVSVQQIDVLNSLIDEILIEQGAARDGYSVTDSEVEQLYANQKKSVEAQAGRTLTDAEFESLVTESYGSVDEYKSYLKLQYLTQSYVSGAKADVLNNVAEPTENEIKTWYRQNSTNFTLPERVRLSLIAMEKTGDSATDSKKLSTLQSCYNDIVSGKITFEKGVQLYSEDTDSLSIGGDWGFMADNSTTRTNMGDNFVNTVMLMDAGDIEGVFETPYIYAIVKCTVHLDPTILTLNDTIEEYGITVREYIRQGLLYQNSQYAFLNAYNELLADLRNQAKINIIPKYESMGIRTERHKARELATDTLYSLDFNSNLPPTGDWDLFQGVSEEEEATLTEDTKVYASFLITGTLEHLDEIDSIISKYSKNRPIENIDCVDRNILRISIFQLLYDKETHPTIVIDEAVKLSQELSNDVSFKFINGILDTYSKENR